MKKLCKVLVPTLIALVAAGGGLWWADYGGTRAVRWAAQKVSERWGLTLTARAVEGNPLRGFLFSGIQLQQQDQVLASLGQVRVDLDRSAMLHRRLKFQFSASSGEAALQGLWGFFSALSGQALFPLPQGLSKERLVLHGLRGILDQESEFYLVGRLMEAPFSGYLKGRRHQGGWTLDEGLFSLAGGMVGLTGPLAPQPDLNVEVHGLNLADLKGPGSLAARDLRGQVDASLTFSGPLNNPALTGSLELSQGSLAGVPLRAQGSLNLRGWVVEADPFYLVLSGVPLSGRVWADLDQWPVMTQLDLRALEPVVAEALKANLPDLPPDLTGQVDQAWISVKGPLTALQGSAHFQAAALGMGSLEGRSLELEATFDGRGAAEIQGSGLLGAAPLELALSVRGGSRGLTAQGSLDLRGFDLSQAQSLVPAHWEALGGTGDLQVTLEGPLADPEMAGQIRCPRLLYGPWEMASLEGSFSLNRQRLLIEPLQGRLKDSSLEAQGTVTLAQDPLVKLQISSPSLGLEALVPAVRGQAQISALLEGRASQLKAHLELQAQELELAVQDLLEALSSRSPAGGLKLLFQADQIQADGWPIGQAQGTLSSQEGQLQLERFQGRFCDGTMTLSGKLASELELDLVLDSADLAQLPCWPSLKDLTLQGRLTGEGEITGTLADPLIRGFWELRDGQINAMAVRGRFGTVLSRREVRLEDLKGALWGGPMEGRLAVVAGEKPYYDMALTFQAFPAEQLPTVIPFPWELSGRLDSGELTFSGTDLKHCTGRVKLEGARVVYDGLPLEGILFDGSAELGGRLKVTASANLAGSPIILSGGLDLTAQTLDFKARAATASMGRLAEIRPVLSGFQGSAVAEVQLFGDLQAPEYNATFTALSAELPYLGALGNLTLRSRGAVRQGILRGQVSLSNLWFQGLPLTDLAWDLTVRDRKWSAVSLAGAVGSGALSGSVALWPALGGSFEIRGFDVSELPRLGLNAPSYQGLVDLRGNVAGTLEFPQITFQILEPTP